MIVKTRGCASEENLDTARKKNEVICSKVQKGNGILGTCLCFRDECNGPEGDAGFQTKLEGIQDPEIVHHKKDENGESDGDNGGKRKSGASKFASGGIGVIFMGIWCIL